MKLNISYLVSSRLDYCNGLFTSLSGKDLTRLQRLQNSAARLVFAVGRVAARTTRPSSEHNRLAIPIISKTIKGEKRFNIAATMAWNSLPIAIKSTTTTVSMLII